MKTRDDDALLGGGGAFIRNYDVKLTPQVHH